MTTDNGEPTAPPGLGLKRCGDCGRSLPQTDFHKRARSHDGLMPRCRGCNYQRSRRWKVKHPDRVRESRIANPRPIIDRALRRLYGIGLDEYEARLARQGGRCAVCGAEPTDKRRLDVDHDHDSGRIRGLLCANCNLALGHMAHSPERARALATYLEGAAA